MGYSTSSAGPQRFRWPLFYLAVALTTLATLLLQLSLTRIFSVVFHYHFAFLAVSIALFGLGAGGIFSYLVADWRGSLFSKLGALAALSCLVVLIALVLGLSIRQNLGFWTLAAAYFPSTLPFFLAGAALTLAIAEGIERVDRVCFYHLIGAGAGCLLLVPLLNAFGGPNTVLAAGAVYAASAAVWYSLAGKTLGRAASVTLALGMLVLLGYNAKFRIIDVRYAKGQTLDDEQFVKWNSFSRVAVAPDHASGAPTVYIDAGASTAIASFDLRHMGEQDRQALLRSGPGFPYVLRPGARTLIIGPGGGWDVARALAGGSRDVTGVEINPIIAETVMQRRFSGYSRGLYSAPEVRIVVEEGRSFVRRSGERYQVIQATLVDTWASTAAGAYALSENNLYTSDAFHDFLRRLTDDGILAFTRWAVDPPRESLRLMSLGRAALGRLGEPEAWRHVMVVREGRASGAHGRGAMDTILISRQPFAAGDLSRAREAIVEAGLEAVYLPGETLENPFTELLRTEHLDAFEERYPFNIRPVTDDRPFFFYTVQPRDFGAFLGYVLRGGEPAGFRINAAVPVMLGLLVVSLAATGIILALPPLVLGARLPRDSSVLTFLLYFLSIGAGYILIQIALIQRFVLFLGHPTYAVTVIVFSTLVASGAGSYFSRRVVGVALGRLGGVMALVALFVLLLTLAVGPVTAAGVGWPLPVKVLLTVLMIAPPAFFMGMPLPTGLSLLESRHKPSVKWAWALNSAASVLGSVCAIFLAIYAGLAWTLLTGGSLYLVALMVLLLTSRLARAAQAASVPAQS